MMKRTMQLLICDRCGFEEDITLSRKPGKYWLELEDFGDLCPKCAKEFRVFTTGFFGDRCPKYWDIEVHCE